MAGHQGPEGGKAHDPGGDVHVWRAVRGRRPKAPSARAQSESDRELFAGECPHLAQVTEPFGLAYYGCCEGLHDRFPLIEKAIPNLRAVSVSGWSNLFQMAEMLGKKYVYSRKPTPTYISGAYPIWELAEKDVRDTLVAAKDCNLEFCFRDIYTVDGDRSRLARWVQMTRALMDA